MGEEGVVVEVDENEALLFQLPTASSLPPSAATTIRNRGGKSVKQRNTNLKQSKRLITGFVALQDVSVDNGPTLICPRTTSARVHGTLYMLPHMHGQYENRFCTCTWYFIYAWSVRARRRL